MRMITNHGLHLGTIGRPRWYILVSGDDCKLKGWDTRTSCEAPIFVNKRFEAGVTCVQTHPFIENLMAVGSYDNTVRIFDSRKMTTSLVEVGVGGGAWRVKWHPSDTRKNELLVACMYDGFKVIKTPINESGQVDATFSSAVSSRFDAHTSIAYGVDWHHGSLTNNPTKSLVASCSFYDHTLCLWSPQGHQRLQGKLELGFAVPSSSPIVQEQICCQSRNLNGGLESLDEYLGSG
ncbi:WD40 domain-containing protein [Rhizoctonia solani AG-1 IA]|uniref:methylated diphthine methylhydrolase n=1 Tax=Thanatephorus cucumeris (strain AG1-IA) TaxID=983506 RepID=L8WTX2_THACA|nr:WD40 domain-containing protein [Rhizoctonia solani AG-1 IA]